MKLSIIIVNYHVKEELLDCIRSIVGSKFDLAYEVIVIDNDEKKTIEKDLKKEFPKVKYIKSPRNIGYGAGNNLGAKLAKGEYLFILNPDTKFYSGNISKVISLFEKDKNIGVIAPLLLDTDNKSYELQGTKELTPGRALFSLSFLSKVFPKNRIYKDYYLLGWNKNKVKEVDVVPGTAFVIKKKLFDKIGGFDEKFFLFFEEFDFCRRIRKTGYRIYISPSLKLIHKWGSSAAQNSESQKYFKQSRFYYFRENFSLLKAIPTEILLRINKQTALLTSIVLIALFLRLYRLSEIMPFISDIGWFYVSARDMMINQQIPLVGIASSHSWVHQGPLWTYFLGIILALFNFNPVAPAYFTVVLDVLTLIFVYFFAKMAFGEKVAIFSSIFYATSPLIIYSSQTPYHTSLIPFFTALLLFSVLKWIKGNILFFPITISLLAILYNLELATFSLTVTTLLILFIGVIKRKKWAIEVSKPRVIGLSCLAFIVPMIPMFLYDLSHGFPQTLKFIVWVLYRIAVFFGYPPINPNAPGETWSTFSLFILDYIGRLYFIKNEHIALVILSCVLLFAFYKLSKSKLKDVRLGVVLVFFMVPAAAYIAAKTNSSAYLPMFFPQAAILFGFFFGSSKRYFVISMIIASIVVGLNLHNLSNRSYADISLSKRVSAARVIVNKAKDRSYSIEEKNKASGFDDFTKNYEYLTWWLGHGPSDKQEKLKYYIKENSSKIEIEEKLNK